MDTSVALIIAKTASPFLRFIRLTEPVVMIAASRKALNHCCGVMQSCDKTVGDEILGDHR